MDDKDMPRLVDEARLNQAAGGGDCNSDDVDDGDDGDYGSSDEEIIDAEATLCLFCSKQLASVDVGLQHLEHVHGISFSQLKEKFNMDQYSFLKLINCIRRDCVSAKQLAAAKQPFWNDEKYLKPKEYEPWLSYDYDELPAPAQKDFMNPATLADHLRTTITALQQKVNDQNELLERATDDMAKMRVSFKRILEKDAELLTTSMDGSDEKANGAAATAHSVAGVSLKADESYFSSYAHFGIHHEMLSDVVRTKSYRDALLLNKAFVRGKDVLDVGCGTSVLSIFAAQAGAKLVVGIDNSDIVYNAMDIVKKNNIDNVTLIKGRLEDTELPQQKFDIIISEWMGYFLLFEGMLDSVIYARDTHLLPDGILLPNRCTMSLIGYGSDALFHNHVSFWNDVYGLDMSNMRKEVLHEPLIDIVDAKHILTEANLIADLDLHKVDLNYSNFSYTFNLKCTKCGTLSAFVGYFDTYFDLPVPVMFSTGPRSKPTHWKQVVFFVDQPQSVKVGDVVTGKLVCRRSRNSARSLDISIEAFGKKYTYYLD